MYPDGNNECLCKEKNPQASPDSKKGVPTRQPTGFPTEDPTFKYEATTWSETIISTIKDNSFYFIIICLLLFIIVKPFIVEDKKELLPTKV